MKKVLAMLMLPFFCLISFSCKSGGKSSSLEGVDMSSLNMPFYWEFLPDNCRPNLEGYKKHGEPGSEELWSVDFDKEGPITGFGKVRLYNKSLRDLDYIILPETCKDPTAKDATYTPTSNSVEVYLTGREQFGSNIGSNIFSIPESSSLAESINILNWCFADKEFVSKFIKEREEDYAKYKDYSHSYKVGGLCNKYLQEQSKVNNITEDAIKFFKKIKGRYVFLGNFYQPKEGGYVMLHEGNSFINILYKNRISPYNRANNVGFIFMFSNYGDLDLNYRNVLYRYELTKKPVNW